MPKNITSNETKTLGGWPFLATLAKGCPWCADPQSEYEPVDPERELCHDHVLEHDGMSEDGYQQMLAAERYDRL